MHEYSYHSTWGISHVKYSFTYRKFSNDRLNIGNTWVTEFKEAYSRGIQDEFDFYFPWNSLILAILISSRWKDEEIVIKYVNLGKIVHTHNKVSPCCPLKFETQNRIYKIKRMPAISMSWILQNMYSRQRISLSEHISGIWAVRPCNFANIFTIKQ